MADTKEDLKAQAEELGIEIEDSWTKADIQAAIDVALESNREPDGDEYVNCGKTDVFIAGIRVKPGKSRTLTDADKADERLMKRLARAIDLGLVKKA